jgi:hypothetical protein
MENENSLASQRVVFTIGDEIDDYGCAVRGFANLRLHLHGGNDWPNTRPD